HADGKPRLRPWVMAPCKTGWALALLVLLHALPALHASPAPRDTLVVGGDAGYAPFQMLDDDGQASGFDVELLRLLARDLGMDVRFELGGWDQALARLERHEVDVVPMFTSDRRGSRFLFTRPYLLRYHGVFGREGRTEVARLDALHPYTVAVQDRGRGWEALEQLEPGPGLVLVR
ncbi:transporter substrate-binding domain-containing protein, partial [Bacillus tequilensis]|nr:transporter substrate-binding domain-containing protein [Bacillus tequilensis]